MVKGLMGVCNLYVACMMYPASYTGSAFES